MIQMIPDVISPEIKSTAEKNLFSEFRGYSIDEKTIVLHSLGVAEHSNNIFGEIDFVIICPDGFLCVEVKGGIVERTSGNWTFTNRYGKRETKPEGPFVQAQGNMQSLRNYMIRKFGKGHPFCQAQYATCVLMPDCRFNNDGFDIVRDVLFDRSRGCDLKTIIRDSFDYWRNDCEVKHGFRGGTLTDSEIQQAADLLRGDFRFVPSLKDVINDTYKELLALTDEQYEILESLEDNPRLLISGLAGTGKSVLAVEQCKRASRCGKSVLYLCFNKNMAQYVNNQFEKEFLSAEASTLHQVMQRNCGSKCDDMDATYFSIVLPQRFLDDSCHVREYDLVVIDEGQDLINGLYLQCIGKLIKGGLAKGSWAVFYDPNQNIYNRSSEMASQLPRLKSMATSYNLTVNCRNTKEIANANTLMTNIPQVNRVKASGPQVEQYSYESLEDERSQIYALIERLKDDGVRNNDVVILSAYSLNNPKCFLCEKGIPSKLGRLKTGGKMWSAKIDEIRFSTISAFKGLESKVLILADVDSFAEESRKLLNYVAISRAEIALFVFYSSASEDERQSMILSGYPKIKQ